MISRRTVLRVLGGLGTGVLTLVGHAAGDSGRADRRSKTDTPPTGETIVRGRATETAIRSARLPNGLSAPIEALDTRLDPVSIDHCDRITGTAVVDTGRIGAGSAVATGSFPADAVREECRRQYTAVTDDEPTQFVGDGIAIAPTDDAIGVGYAADDTEAARSRLDRTLASDPSQAVDRQSGATLESILSGDAVVTATLGSGTRTWLSDRLAEADGPLPAVVDAAEEVGIAATVRSGDRTDLTYGVVAPPDRLSTETVRDVIRAAETGPETIDNVRLTRSGRGILVNAECSTSWAVGAHTKAAGTDDRH